MIHYIDNTKTTFEDFLANKAYSIGASEVGPIVWGSPYTSNVEIFYHKVTGYRPTFENLATYRGRKSEIICDELYPYYDGKSDESIYINEHKGIKLREVEDRKVTIRNDKYPHLTATPDRFINAFGTNQKKGEGFAEYKTTQSWVLKKYQDELPPDNVMQLCTQVKMGEVKYGDLFYYIDNRTCRLYQQKASGFNNTWQIILDVTIPFWENVIKARPIYNALVHAKSVYDMRKAAQLEVELAQLEPPVQDTDGYLKFLTEKYKDRVAGVGMITGTNTELLIAQKHKQLAAKIKKLEEDKLKQEIQLKAFMKNAIILDFGAEGQCTWIHNDKGRPFKNNVKI